MTAKIIKSDDVNVTLGYDDGTFEEIPRAELKVGEFVKDGTVLDVYKNGDAKVYAIANRSGEGFGEFGDKLTNEVRGKHRVSKVAYILCALFLGGLGVHKFLAGKWILGIIYLLLCWTLIPAIVSIIEAIIAATKTSDVYGNIEI